MFYVEFIIVNWLLGLILIWFIFLFFIFNGISEVVERLLVRFRIKFFLNRFNVSF